MQPRSVCLFADCLIFLLPLERAREGTGGREGNALGRRPRGTAASTFFWRLCVLMHAHYWWTGAHSTGAGCSVRHLLIALHVGQDYGCRLHSCVGIAAVVRECSPPPPPSTVLVLSFCLLTYEMSIVNQNGKLSRTRNREPATITTSLHPCIPASLSPFADPCQRCFLLYECRCRHQVCCIRWCGFVH